MQTDEKLQEALEKLHAVLERNWFKPARGDAPRFPPPWDFVAELAGLSRPSLVLVSKLHILRRPLREIGSLIELLLSGWSMPLDQLQEVMSSEELVTTLKLMTVCEFGLEGLLAGPATVKARELRRLAEGCGVEPDELRCFIQLWRALREARVEERRRNAA